MSDFISNSDAQQDYILVRTLGRGAFGEANLYRKIEVRCMHDAFNVSTEIGVCFMPNLSA